MIGTLTFYRYRSKTKRRTSNVWNINICMDIEVKLTEKSVMFGHKIVYT